MSNTQKTILFILSLLVFFASYTLLNPLFIKISLSFPAAFMFCYFLSYLLQVALKKYVTAKKLMGFKVFTTYQVKPMKIVDRISIYLIPFAILIIPEMVHDNIPGALFSLFYIVLFAVILEVIMLIFQKPLVIYLTNSGILISGWDFRIEMPFGANYNNNSGFYNFSHLDLYTVSGNTLFIRQTYDGGKIKITADYGEIEAACALLRQNGVKEGQL